MISLSLVFCQTYAWLNGYLQPHPKRVSVFPSPSGTSEGSA